MQKSFEQQGPPRRAASSVWDVDLSEEFCDFPSLTTATVPANAAVRPQEQDRSEPKRRRAEVEPSSAVGRGTAAQPPASALGSFEQRDQLDKGALPVQVIRKGADEVSCSTPSVPASGSSEWLSGAALEDILSNQTPEQLQKIEWLAKPPHVGRRRAAEPTAVVVVAQKAVLCKLLGVGASRVV